MLPDNPDNENGLLEFADQFEAVSELKQEPREFGPIYLVPRRHGVLSPIRESADEEMNVTNQVLFHVGPVANVVERNLNNNGELITSKICNIL